MQLTERQEIILNSLIKQYIDRAEPISSNLLQQKSDLDISPATIRNELQELAQQGYVSQPHTSAGRVPTIKAYKYFVEITFTKDEPLNLKKEIDSARQNIESELKLAQELTKSLAQISSTLSYTRFEGKSFNTAQDRDSILEILKIIGPSRTTYHKNIDVMRELLEELENF